MIILEVLATLKTGASVRAIGSPLSLRCRFGFWARIFSGGVGLRCCCGHTFESSVDKRQGSRAARSASVHLIRVWSRYLGAPLSPTGHGTTRIVYAVPCVPTRSLLFSSVFSLVNQLRKNVNEQKQTWTTENRVALRWGRRRGKCVCATCSALVSPWEPNTTRTRRTCGGKALEYQRGERFIGFRHPRFVGDRDHRDRRVLLSPLEAKSFHLTESQSKRELA